MGGGEEEALLSLLHAKNNTGPLQTHSLSTKGDSVHYRKLPLWGRHSSMAAYAIRSKSVFPPTPP